MHRDVGCLAHGAGLCAQLVAQAYRVTTTAQQYVTTLSSAFPCDGARINGSHLDLGGILDDTLSNHPTIESLPTFATPHVYVRVQT